MVEGKKSYVGSDRWRLGLALTHAHFAWLLQYTFAMGMAKLQLLGLLAGGVWQ